MAVGHCSGHEQAVVWQRCKSRREACGDELLILHQLRVVRTGTSTWVSNPKRLPGLRFSLRKMVGCVAVVAVIAAMMPPRSATAASSVWVACVLVAVVSHCTSSRWISAAACISSSYPVFLSLSLYSTWLAAWYKLGHRPRISLDDPKFIGPLVTVLHRLTWVLLGQFEPVSKTCLFLIPISAFCSLVRGKTSPPVTISLAAVPFFFWISCVLLLRWDPGLVVYWFLD